MAIFSYSPSEDSIFDDFTIEKLMEFCKTNNKELPYYSEKIRNHENYKEHQKEVNTPLVFVEL